MADHKPHKNIRGAEYYAQAAEETAQRQLQTDTPVQRLRKFVEWAQGEGLCRNESHFERLCGLSNRYIYNNISSGKGNIGTEMLGRIVKVFPRINLAWICTGEGAMLMREEDGLNADYKMAYEGAMMQIEALNRIIKQLNTK